LTSKQDQDNPPPSLRPHYRSIIATTRRSAPLPRIGTLPLTVSTARGPPSRRPGQHPDRPYRGEGFPRSAPEPEPSSRHLCAGQPPDQEHRHPPDSSRGNNWTPVSVVVCTLSTFLQWFTRVRLLGSHLTHPVRLFRGAHHHGSFTTAARGGLGPPPARAVPEGPPPSPVQHRHHQSRFYIATSSRVRGAQSSA
jgi:hypothetical protein